MQRTAAHAIPCYISSSLHSGIRMMPKPLAPPRLAVRPLTAAIAVALGGGMLQAVRAQDENTSRAVAPEEMTVTASRRETRVHEVPFNITAIDGATLERQRLTTLSEVARSVPGLTVVEQGARSGSLMTVRGLTVLVLNASEYLDNGSGGTVATYVGEIPLYLHLTRKD